ncbi:MAG TPA: hypothetical protein VJU80_08970 [Solirubrobacteraceae bacterium]|nr:hypothetical protein [Solirubrobacteraceae bacterium]
MRLLMHIWNQWAQSRRYRMAVDQLRMESERFRLSKERDLARYFDKLADYIEGKS